MKAMRDMDTAELAGLVLSRAVEEVGGCLVYMGHLNKGGYGELSSSGKYHGMVHRIVWESANGPIPEGLVVDHTCFVRPCVRLDHLRLLTNATNAGLTRRAIATVCPNGHEYSPENTRITKRGTRLCRICNAASALRYYHQARIEAAR